jgi:DEP domain-containing protein
MANASSPDRRGFVGLVLAAPEDERLLKAALESQGIAAGNAQASVSGLAAMVHADPRMSGPTAIVADVASLEAQGVTPGAFVQRLHQARRGMEVFVRLPSRSGIAAHEREWAAQCGIASLLPGSSAAAWQDSLAPVIGRIASTLGMESLDAAALEACVNRLVKAGSEPRPGPVKDIYAHAWRLEGEGVNASVVLESLQGAPGLVADRRYRGKLYRDCFVASEAIEWMVKTLGMRRATALSAGRFLWRTGRIHHVLREAAFDDGLFFFRFGLSRAASARLDLAEIEREMRLPTGVPISDRTYLGKSYPRSLIGTEAVEWLMRRHGLARGEAEAVGQSLVDLGVLHHVVDEHGFVDDGYFYRFRVDDGN